jgi:predicted ribosome quality control (RQC) complex YloA/Tae2 family protein
MIMDKSRKIQNFKDNNFFKGEPVRVKSKGNGYVVEDYLEDFIIEKEIKKDSEDKKEKIENEIKINEEVKKEKKEKKKRELRIKKEKEEKEK